MGSDKQNIEYLLIIIGLIIANVFCFLIILKSEEIIDEVRMSSAQDIIDYIIQVNDNEKNNAEKIFEYSNDIAICTREQVLNNKELIKNMLSEFNFLFPDYNNMYVVFENNDYMVSSGESSTYFSRHDASADSGYQKVREASGFVTLKYNSFDGDNVYVYAYPLYDKNRIPYGILVRTRDLDWICNETIKLNSEEFKFTLVIKDPENNIAAICDENGQKNIKNTSDLNVLGNKLLKEKNVSYYDKETQLTYYIIPNDEGGASYTTLARIISILTLIAFAVVMFLYLKKKNIIRDLRIVVLVLFVTVILYFIIFLVVFQNESIKKNVLQSRISVSLDEDRMALQNVILQNIESKTFDKITESNSTDTETVLRRVNDSISKELISLLYVKDLYLIKDNVAINLCDGELIRDDEVTKNYYKLICDEPNIYKNFVVPSDNYKDSLYIKTYIITDSNSREKYVLAAMYDAYQLDKAIINNTYSFNTLSECYILNIKEDHLQMTPLINYTAKAGYEFDTNFKTIENEKIRKNVINLTKSDDTFKVMYTFANDNTIKKCVMTKTKYLDFVKISFVDYSLMDEVNIKVSEYIIGLILIYLSLFVLKKFYDRYQKGKKETIQLHGNY